MPNPNVLPSSLSGFVGIIDPDVHVAATYTTGWIDMSKRAGIQAIVMVGTMVATSTVDERAASDAGDLNGGAISGARTLASSANETLCFEVDFPSADTAPQGAAADAEFVFDSTQT